MAMVFASGKTAHNTRDSGAIVLKKAKAVSATLMAQFSLETFHRTTPMVKARRIFRMAVSSLEIS
jgi:hypothetical protein